MTKKNGIMKVELIKRSWDIDGHPTYFFGNDKKLYRFDARGQVKQNKRVIIGSTQGYILKRKFYSLSQLRPMLRRHMTPEWPTTDYPTDF